LVSNANLNADLNYDSHEGEYHAIGRPHLHLPPG